MDDDMGSVENNSSSRKPMRRRSHKRKTTHDLVINMAEARREIAHVLQLHRSSSSSSSSSATSGTSSTCTPNAKANPYVIGNFSSNSYNNIETNLKHNVNLVAANNSSQYRCYSITDALPNPEPVWSTTAPSILATPPPILLEPPECEWGFENQAATYSWWLGFLKALDGSVTAKNGVPAYPCVDGGVVMDGDPSRMLGVGEPPDLLDPRDQTSFADEWLIFPTTVDHEAEIKGEK